MTSDKQDGAGHFQQHGGKLFSAFGMVFVLSALPLFFSFNSPGVTLLGLPGFVVWFSVCFFLYALLTIIAYRMVFRFWKSEGEVRGE